MQSKLSENFGKRRRRPYLELFWGLQGGAEISLGGAAPLLPWNRPWQNVKQNAAGLRCFLREDGISLA